MKKLSILVVAILSLLMQIRVAYGCEMMPGGPRIHCCCPGQHCPSAVAGKHHTGKACCDVQLISADAASDELKAHSGDFKFELDNLAPPLAFALALPPQAVQLVVLAQANDQPPALPGTDTYLVTARLRL